MLKYIPAHFKLMKKEIYCPVFFQLIIGEIAVMRSFLLRFFSGSY